MTKQNPITNTLKWMKTLNLETLEALRYMLFFIVIADLFGLWWYLRLKSLSMAIFMVSALLLALILMREAVLKNEIEVKKDFPKIMKGGNKKMAEDEESDEDEEEEQEESKKKDKKEKDKEEPYSLGLDLRGSGLPDPDEYQKRAEKALGTMSFF